MKSQDIVLLLKLISLHGHSPRVCGTSPNIESQILDSQIFDFNEEWAADMDEKRAEPAVGESRFSVRNMAIDTGISKSQISLSLNRCIDIGLAKHDHKSNLPKANASALVEFIAHGIRYVFPAKPGAMARGIPTSFAAPILLGQLMTSGELPPVWPDAKGKVKGVTIEPLHKNINVAIHNDPVLYAMLALTDSVRIGQPRERNLAVKKLDQLLKELQ
ncbi:MAG: hypothetical protein KUG78_09260 [Kangiellaceae bacterium]|nr:hypothetical protein [Kangiellaceae bacterium]